MWRWEVEEEEDTTILQFDILSKMGLSSFVFQMRSPKLRDVIRLTPGPQALKPLTTSLTRVWSCLCERPTRDPYHSLWSPLDTRALGQSVILNQDRRSTMAPGTLLPLPTSTAFLVPLRWIPWKLLPLLPPGSTSPWPSYSKWLQPHVSLAHALKLIWKSRLRWHTGTQTSLALMLPLAVSPKTGQGSISSDWGPFTSPSSLQAVKICLPLKSEKIPFRGNLGVIQTNAFLCGGANEVSRGTWVNDYVETRIQVSLLPTSQPLSP